MTGGAWKAYAPFPNSTVAAIHEARAGVIGFASMSCLTCVFDRGIGMSRRTAVIAIAVACLLGVVVIVCLAVLPGWLYPSLTTAELHAVTGASDRIQLQQTQAQLQNGVRASLLQTFAGLLVVIGAAATWWQVRVNREGQITERFTRAIEHVGSDNMDIRIGGIYALERIARNSSNDRRTVQFILGAFIRNHAPWHVGMVNGPVHPTVEVDERPWLQFRAADLQAAAIVLARAMFAVNRMSTAEPGGAELYLSRVDLRGLQVSHGHFTDVHFRYANLARSWLRGCRFDRSDFTRADLRRTWLEGASFAKADLTGAYLAGANLRNADLRAATVCGTDFSGCDLTGAELIDAHADAATRWPTEFDAERLAAAGVHVRS